MRVNAKKIVFVILVVITVSVVIAVDPRLDLNREKRGNGLPVDAHNIIIHNMRHFDVYGSSTGAYIVSHGSYNVKKVQGLNGNVINGIIADKFFHQIYNIYLTVKSDNCVYEYFVLKDGEMAVSKIKGLPDDAQLLAIHNLAGVLFFGSSDGAYELTQGETHASKVSNTNGYVVHIILNGSANKYDAKFITAPNSVDKCKRDLELTTLHENLNGYAIKNLKYQDEITELSRTVSDQRNKLENVYKNANISCQEQLHNLTQIYIDQQKKLENEYQNNNINYQQQINKLTQTIFDQKRNFENEYRNQSVKYQEKIQNLTQTMINQSQHMELVVKNETNIILNTIKNFIKTTNDSLNIPKCIVDAQ